MEENNLIVHDYILNVHHIVCAQWTSDEWINVKETSEYWQSGI